jgi:signal transduction histidine kinase
MLSPITPRSHPLRFLLQLEWVLLAIVAVSEFSAVQFHPLPRHPGLNLLGVALFTMMGLRLPQQRLSKVSYTLIELGLILLMSWVSGLRLFQLLYVVLVIRNCLMFEAWQKSLITALAFGLCAVTQWYRLQSFSFSPQAVFPERLRLLWLSIVLLIGLVLLFLQLLVTAVLQERQSREQLAVSNARLREYALQIEELATLQERNRIAREIHDSLGHSLTVFNLHLEAALRLLRSDLAEAEELLVEAKQLGSAALRDVRQSVAALRSDPLQGRSLPEAISILISDFQRSTGISPQFQYQVHFSLSTKLETAIYRIVQEALTNICKYATATQVSVFIQMDKDLQIIIEDNGQGFDSTQTTSGFGLQGMQERTLALHGQFTLVTAPQAGCRITAIFPLDLPSL